MLSVAGLTFEDDGTPCRHAWDDTSLAAFSHAASDGSRVVRSPDGRVRCGKGPRRSRYSSRVEPVAMIAVGYSGDPAMLDDKLRQREIAPRQGKAVTAFVPSGTWNAPPAWLT
jgi:hypothetical protein